MADVEEKSPMSRLLASLNTFSMLWDAHSLMADTRRDDMNFHKGLVVLTRGFEPPIAFFLEWFLNHE